jgi:hypothetical protein
MDVEINYKGTIMKTLEHTIRDVMSGKREQDLIEEVNNNFINIINTVYEEKLSEEKFIELYNLYIDHLIEQEPWYSNLYQGAKNTASSLYRGAAKYGSKAIAPVGAALDAGLRYSEGQPTGQILAGTGASLAGGLAGSWAGAKTLGTAGGIIGGPVGAGIGTVVGGIGGGILGSFGGSKYVDAMYPNAAAKPPTSNTQPTTAAPATPPVSPPGANTNVAPTTTQPAERRGGTSGAVRSLDQKLNQPETPTPPSAPTSPVAPSTSTSSSRTPEMMTPLAGNKKDDRMSVPSTTSVPPSTGTAPSSPAAPSTKSQEPPESSRKQKPTTSSGSSYSGNMIGDYGKDNSWVQSAFNRG